MLQIHLFISGFVQGVGFRQHVRLIAREIGVTGWVRNLSDGRVEAVLQGNKKSIDTAISRIEQGSIMSEVKSLEIDWEPIKEEFKEFTIKKEQ